MTRENLPATWTRDRIVEALGWLGTAGVVEIAQAVGISNQTAHLCCCGMYNKGMLVRIGNGNGPVRYRISESGVAAVRAGRDREDGEEG